MLCIIKLLLNSVFRDIQNYQGLIKCYQPQPQPSASADNTYLALDNSGSGVANNNFNT